MKILQVYNFFKPSWEAGGMVRSVYEISKALVDKGHDVTVYATDGYQKRLNVPKNRPVTVDGIRTYYFRNMSLLLSKNLLITTPYYLPFIARKEVKNFDIIHIHGNRTSLAPIVAYYAKKYDVPYILEPRASAHRISKSSLKYLQDKLYGYNLFNEAEELIFSSKSELALAKGMLKETNVCGEKIKFVPNGINIQVDDKNISKDYYTQNFNLKKDGKIILYLGRIHKRKGLDMLINAFESLSRKSEEELYLFIIGPDDGYIKKLRSMIKESEFKDQIFIPGPRYEEEKFSAYNSADLFVLPSKDKQESFGNVILEAASFSTTCIATNVCGVTEWMENVIKVDPDVESIKKGIEKGLKAKGLGERARQEVENEFSWNAIVEDELIPLYKRIITKKNI